VEPAGPIPTAHLFAPLHAALTELLRVLSPEDWDRPTVAGRWSVRDVAAHLLDTQLRRLSAQRDGHAVLPARPIESDRDLAAHLHALNADWVAAARRLSPRILVELLDATAPALASLFASLPLHGPAIFAVSWAGQTASENWMDVGREYTERWHHQAQIRDAVGAPALDGREFLHPVLELSLYGLPVAFRDTPAGGGTSVVVEVGGEAGGVWTLRRETGGWKLWRGEAPGAAMRASMDPDTAWRLFFNALPAAAARSRVRLEGDAVLAGKLLEARGVVI
jgi:uncharacterized protein (TIGR03083 family)